MIKTDRFYWAVVMPNARLCHWSISSRRKDSQTLFLRDWPSQDGRWGEWRKQGYRTIKIRIEGFNE